MEVEVENKIFKIEEWIKASGYKCTAPRDTLIRLFVETKRHLRPEEIYMLTKAQGVSLPTVYRNIDLLKRIGVIKEIVIQKERYYELNMFSRKKLHIHFSCNQCGQIKEYLDSKIFRDMIEQRDYIEEVFHDDIEDVTIVMNGICDLCKERNHSDN
ncbi:MULTISPECIES: Fur family transcriptional regulator [Mesobacillus]|uniref:Transcriptional repressor n=2 Tax=Mesobacillus TaxID=2675231 RepID=A0A0D6ZC95_9BACI|nr:MULTISPECIES: transcriptional repressor [Mesobacillus]KIY22676.1 hypothetical protein UB32_07265 [Mesobacillus subterraneus]MDQ0414301.1 Fe2+ or Zn2+ uptake regulation protein [Mesobacillus stamsii]